MSPMVRHSQKPSAGIRHRRFFERFAVRRRGFDGFASGILFRSSIEIDLGHGNFHFLSALRASHR